jgi:hypothetical protein
VEVRQAIAEAARLLAAVSDTPRLDAELLMAHALGVERDQLLLRRLDDETPRALPRCWPDARAASRSPTSREGAPSGRSSWKSAPAFWCHDPTPKR